MKKEIDLSVTPAGIKMDCPVMVASGTFGCGEEYDSLLDLNRLGALVVKGITLQPRRGNPPTRIVETPAGMLNAIGLENVGLEVFMEKKLPFLKQFAVPVIVNICGADEEEYVRIAARLDGVEGVSGLELNISCPNIKKGGLSFGREAGTTRALVAKVRKVTRLPLLVKLSPNVTDIAAIGRAAEEAGADGLSLINTLLGMSIDIREKRPKLANITGGLSGPAIKPIALLKMHQVHRVCKPHNIPIIGQGGIATAQDALEFIIAGASAVGIGTALFYDPLVCNKINAGISEYLKQHHFNNVSDLVGTLQLNS